MSPLRLGVGLVGPGAIGSTFLKQLGTQKKTLLSRFKIDVNVVGIMGSRRMILDPQGIDLADWRHPYEHRSVDADLGVFFDWIKGMHDFGGWIFVDGTASDDVPEAYHRWLEAGCHIVTPNKRFGSGPSKRYKQVRQLCIDRGNHFMYEATVGAGLPVVSTLQAMIDTGDDVHTIEGIFSGTLSYIFNEVSSDVSFSAAVAKAKERGYTEPDPRDDLSGMDVARKVVVLARECGMEVELNDLEIQSLVPGPLQSVADAQTFMDQLSKYDRGMLDQISEADAKGEVLRYVGVIDVKNQKCEVGLRRYPRGHAFGGLNGTDNMVIFRSERYNDQALVIRGPGAGAEVTAMGVFSDFLTVARRIKQ